MADSRTVLILGLNYAPESTGIAPYTTALASALSKRGLHVHAEVTHPHYPDWKIWDGYGQWTLREQVAGVSVVRRRHYVPRRPRGLRRLASELSFGARLLVAGWGRRDLTIAVSPALFATLVASFRRGRSPFIVWVQDVYTLGLLELGEGGALAAKLARFAESRVLRTADRIVVVHERFRDFVVEQLGVDAERVVVVQNWTHLPSAGRIDRSAARLTLGWREDEIIALHAGNMGAKQGLENVIEAARLAVERDIPVRFILLGGGGELERLRRLAAPIERIEFVDPLPESDFRAALAAADVLLVNEKPGVAAMAVPSKLTSYFDAGRPVIAAVDESGTTAEELRVSGGGVVVAAGKPAALLDAVIDLGSDRARADRLGEAGRRYRDDELGQDRAISRWLAVLDGLV